MKFSVDVENISKILFLNLIFFENMNLKNISAWLGGNLLLRLLPETVVAGHINVYVNNLMDLAVTWME